MLACHAPISRLSCSLCRVLGSSWRCFWVPPAARTQPAAIMLMVCSSSAISGLPLSGSIAPSELSCGLLLIICSHLGPSRLTFLSYADLAQ